MIGNTHFDPVWLWTWDEAMASIRSTFRAALARMREEEQFRYSFSCPPVFQWIEKTEPEMFAEIQARVKEGRWRLDEGMWLQPDCFSAAGESYARQCLYGQKYLYKNFGVYSDTAFNGDCFGCPETLPQILKKSGMPYAVFGRPDERDLSTSSPLFAWTSPDGSVVLSCRLSDGWGAWSQDVGAEIDRALAYSDRTGENVLLCYGVTDHGGAPTKRDIAKILEKQKETDGRVVFSGTTEYFEAEKLSHGAPDTVREIPIRYFGVFCDLPDVKRENRRAENLLLAAERLAVLDARLNRTAPPAEMLHAAWEDVLFNQFHDILGGSSIRDAYHDVRSQFGRAETNAGEYLHCTIQRLTRQIGLPADGDALWNLVVWNLHPAVYAGEIEAEVQWAWELPWYKGEISVTDEDGREYPCQVLQARETIPGFRSRFVFSAELPAMGYRVFRVHCRAAKAIPDSDGLSVAENVLENRFLRVTLDGKTGGILSVYDKEQGKPLSGALGTPVVRADASDVWAFNFTGYGDAEPFAQVCAKVLETGPLRVRVHVKTEYHHSVLDIDYLLSRDARCIDVRYRMLWQEGQRACRLRFVSAAEDPKLTASVPYGQTGRKKDGHDMPVGAYLTFEDEEHPFTLYSDGLFSVCAEGNAMELNVVRSPVYGELHMGELPEGDYEYLGQGPVEGKWRADFSRHTARKRRDAADFFVSPVVTVDESHHDGHRPLKDSFFSLSDTENAVRLTALKPAEDNPCDTVLRMENTSGAETAASFTLAGASPVSGVKFAPYEIKTLYVSEKGDVREVNILEI